MVCVQMTWDAQEGCIKALPKQRQLKAGERRVLTTLEGKKANEVLNSVIGQLSDGMWENSPRMVKYWMFADIDEDNSIIVKDGWGTYCGRGVCSGFQGKTDDEVRKFFSDKIKAILREYVKDGGDMTNVCYLSYKEEISYDECKAIAKELVKGVQ